MIEEDRDSKGRLRVPYFIKLIREFCNERSAYDAGNFKLYVESLKILKKIDWDCESNGYPKWKHRIDRAAQKVFTDI
jgi:hypothetical protein